MRSITETLVGDVTITSNAISIVIPSYNQREYLDQAIQSALSQTIKAEVIVVDDGSTDGSLEIAKSYPVKVISQVNKGLASARNTGIMNASGNYILFLDADDFLEKNCTLEILKKFDETGADIVSPSFRVFGVRSGDVILMPSPKLEDFKQGNRVGYCSAVKKSALLEVGGYSPRMAKGYEDLHLWINLLIVGKTIETLPQVLWNYRTKENSMYTDSLKHHEELMAQIYKDFPQFV